jgi:hypothetical protein
MANNVDIAKLSAGEGKQDWDSIETSLFCFSYMFDDRRGGGSPAIFTVAGSPTSINNSCLLKHQLFVRALNAIGFG